MKLRTGWLVLALCAFGGGCGSYGETPKGEPQDDGGEDGVACRDQPREGAGRVYVDIAYGDDGTPGVAADTCAVWPGTTIVWRTPSGEARPFEILFKGDAPGSPLYERGVGERDRYRASLTAPEVEAEMTYAYGIRANGRTLDPVIIIRPR